MVSWAVSAGLIAGLTFLGGLVVYIWSFFVPGEKTAAQMPSMEPAGEAPSATAAAEAAS